MSVKDYDPRLIALWNDAALAPQGISLPFNGNTWNEALNKATTQRHRMYRLRKDLEREKHPVSDNAKKCKISTRVILSDGKVINYSSKKTWKDADVKRIELHIIAHAADTSMDEALASAGYSVPAAPSLDDL